MVVDITAAAVEFDSRIAMADLEVKELGVMLAGERLGQVEEPGGDSLPSAGGFDEQFIRSVSTTAWNTAARALGLRSRRGRLERTVFSQKGSD